MTKDVIFLLYFHHYPYHKLLLLQRKIYQQFVRSLTYTHRRIDRFKENGERESGEIETKERRRN